MNKIAKKHDPIRAARAFQEAEASLALEGLDPSGPLYDKIKALRISGEISADEAAAMIREEALREFPQAKRD